MKRTIIITGIVAGIIIIALVVFNKLVSKKDTDTLYTEVKKGPFEIAVTNSGELEAERSIDIKGPEIRKAVKSGSAGRWSGNGRRRNASDEF